MNSLCQLASDWRGDMPTDGLSWEQKVDGWRCLYFTGTDGVARLWTRNGMPLEGASHVLKRLKAMEQAAGMSLFIDGEIQVDGTLAATKHWFETGWRQGGDKGMFHAFDVLPFAEWKSGGTDTPLYQRRGWLRDLFAVSEPESDGWTWEPGSKGAAPPTAVQIVDGGWLFDARDVQSEVRRIWAEGGEGIVLKDSLAPYRRNRNAAWQKVKAENMHKWMRRAA